jgi:hypothetical protein
MAINSQFHLARVVSLEIRLLWLVIGIFRLLLERRQSPFRVEKATPLGSKRHFAMDDFIAAFFVCIFMMYYC